MHWKDSGSLSIANLSQNAIPALLCLIVSVGKTNMLVFGAMYCSIIKYCMAIANVTLMLFVYRDFTLSVAYLLYYYLLAGHNYSTLCFFLKNSEIF